MDFQILKSDKFQSSNWSGGTTTELFIFPRGAQYKERNFQFRISNATVETETSDFTVLPGVSRKLMILSGSTHISVEGRFSRQMKKFDVVAFEGDWKTRSEGKCSDFNLMTIGAKKSELEGLVLNKLETLLYPLTEKCDWVFIFVHAGEVSIRFEEEKADLQNGDLFVIHQSNSGVLEILPTQNSELVVARILD
jgi:environmental stress-induced protein Ves